MTIDGGQWGGAWGHICCCFGARRYDGVMAGPPDKKRWPLMRPGVGAYLRSFRRKPESAGNGWAPGGAGMAG